MSINNVIDLCCGCTVCADVCPLKAISLHTSDKGFLLPVVDSNTCIECGLCEKYCSIMNHDSIPFHTSKLVLAAKAKETTVLCSSQSGGAFYIIAKEFINKKGVVYGACLCDDFVTRHIRVDSVSALSKLQSTKYVQSDLKGIYSKVASDLSQYKVLFSGTPCQISGLIMYLKSQKVSTDHLLLCDVVCFGVPSPGVFADWIKVLQKSYRSKLQEVHFRDLDEKWGAAKEKYVFQNDQVIKGSMYTRWYFENLITRESCHHCPFCISERVSDITLGDFWGIENISKDHYDERGVSLIMLNTGKAIELWESIKNEFISGRFSVEDAQKAQPRLRGENVSVSAEKRNSFWTKYKMNGCYSIAEEYEFVPKRITVRVKKKLRKVFFGK